MLQYHTLHPEILELLIAEFVRLNRAIISFWLMGLPRRDCISFQLISSIVLPVVLFIAIVILDLRFIGYDNLMKYDSIYGVT